MKWKNMKTTTIAFLSEIKINLAITELFFFNATVYKYSSLIICWNFIFIDIWLPSNAAWHFFLPCEIAPPTITSGVGKIRHLGLLLLPWKANLFASFILIFRTLWNCNVISCFLSFLLLDSVVATIISTHFIDF